MIIVYRSRGLIRRLLAGGVAFGLTAGMAAAQTVTIPWPTVTFKGSVDIRSSPGQNECVGSYTVPAGLKLRITSFLLDSVASPTAVPLTYLCSGIGKCTTGRTAYLTAPAQTSLAVTLTSGILFNPGEAVYACNLGPHQVSYSMYGFLYR